MIKIGHVVEPAIYNLWSTQSSGSRSSTLPSSGADQEPEKNDNRGWSQSILENPFYQQSEYKYPTEIIPDK